MKKQLTLLVISLVSFLVFCTEYAYTQDCTPDTTIKTTGLYPKQMPDGRGGMPYHEVFQFKFPKDTTIFSQKKPFDSVLILKIENLPHGFTWKCNAERCKYPGGANGCAVISGAPEDSQARDYDVKVTVLAYLRWTDTTTLPIQQSDIIKLKVRSSAESIEALPIIKKGINFYPNPFSDKLEVFFYSETLAKTRLSIFDMNGKVVFEEKINVSEGNNLHSIQTAGFKPGCYRVAIGNDQMYYSGKVMLIR